MEEAGRTELRQGWRIDSVQTSNDGMTTVIRRVNDKGEEQTMETRNTHLADGRLQIATKFFNGETHVSTIDDQETGTDDEWTDADGLDADERWCLDTNERWRALRAEAEACRPRPMRVPRPGKESRSSPN